MQFFFIRHGESLWNMKNLCQGQKDIELSPKGLNDAWAFAKKSAHLPIGYICTSPLKRALKTAQIIMQYHQHAGIVDPLA
jgi:broad specificity phosphatase PhoE